MTIGLSVVVLLSVSRGLFSLFEQLRLFNDSVEEMFQQFEEFSGLYLNEQLPHSSTEVFKRTVSVVCPAGSVQLDAFCGMYV